MLLFGVFSFVSLANYNTGILGSWANNGLHFLFGMGAFLSVLVIIFMGGYYVLTAKPFHSNRYFYYFGVLFCLCLSLIHHFFVPIGEEFGISNLLEYGGAIGSAISWALHISVGEMGTSIILVGAIVIDILLLTHWSVSNGARKVGVKAQKIGLKTEQKLEDAASYWKQKRAQINAEKSAARLEPLEESRGDSFTRSQEMKHRMMKKRAQIFQLKMMSRYQTILQNCLIPKKVVHPYRPNKMVLI